MDLVKIDMTADGFAPQIIRYRRERTLGVAPRFIAHGQIDEQASLFVRKGANGSHAGLSHETLELTICGIS